MLLVVPPVGCAVGGPPIAHTVGCATCCLHHLSPMPSHTTCWVRHRSRHSSPVLSVAPPVAPSVVLPVAPSVTLPVAPLVTLPVAPPVTCTIGRATHHATCCPRYLLHRRLCCLLLHLLRAWSVVPPIACVVCRALGRTVGCAACCLRHMSHCLSGVPLVSHPLPMLLVVPPPVAHAVSHHLLGAPSVAPPIACAVCRAVCCTTCCTACCPRHLLHHPLPIPSVVLPVAHAVLHSHSMLCVPSVAPSIACMVVRSVTLPVACVASCTTCWVCRLSGHPLPTPVACGDLYAEPGESKKNWCYSPARIGMMHCR